MSLPKHHSPRGFRNNYVASVTKSLEELLRWHLHRRGVGLPPPPLVPTPCEGADVDFIRRKEIAA